MLIPSEQHPDVRSALEAAIDNGCTIRAAVAFVTRSGVAELASIMANVQGASIEITARAANVTEPEALEALRDLGADVSVVIGRHAQAFHPKIWLVQGSDAFVVISGSGNLTNGGLIANDEQFEVLEFARDDPIVEAHLERIEVLTRHALPLSAVIDSAIWREWLDVRRAQARHQLELRRIERQLNDRDPIPDRAVDKARLIEDLQRVYDGAVEADLPRADGQQYFPTRLLVAIRRARDGEREAVKVVTDTIRRESSGFDILLDAGRVDLTLEWLVVNEGKPYHDLFGEQSVALARERVEEFRAAGHEIPAQPGGRVPTREVMSTDQVREHLSGLVAGLPAGVPLPVLHQAQATLIAVDNTHAVVRRNSGTSARIPLRLVRVRLELLARGRRFRVSELRAREGDRFNSALGPLLAAMPGVAFDREEERLYYAA